MESRIAPPPHNTRVNVEWPRSRILAVGPGAVNESSSSRWSRARESSDLMANERDAQGNMICPGCREVIRAPDPFVDDQAVIYTCTVGTCP